jgi:hypothetical protein
LLGLAATLPVSAQTAAPVSTSAPAPAKSIQDLTAKLQAQPGFLDVWRDADRARVLLAAGSLGQPFLMSTSLPYALGSNDVALDRGQIGQGKIVHFEKHGARLFLVQENTRFVANSPDRDERASAVEAFAGAVIWSGDILATDGGKYLVDFTSFVMSDRHGIVRRLNDTKQGAYQLDDQRSAALPELAKCFPDNTEFEAMLTFRGPGEGAFVRQVAADATSLTLRQHISLVRLPDLAYKKRPYHPASGGFASGYVDYAQPLAESKEVNWQVRHRLEKTDPSAALSPVKKPIVYYLDRGTPEPVRSALLDGARWWVSAFEKAGFKDAYRVELLPEGVDPMDIRYNVIEWVHRATRGWSYGSVIRDPRTGEIIKGMVTLGSLRVRQDILIAESLLAPYAKGNNGEKKKMAEQMALLRLRQLAAHEVGHTLGFAHNFAASRSGNASVMDYPHPLVKLNAAGEVDLQDAYGVGVGAWDDYIVKYLYSDFGADETVALAKLRAEARAKNLLYVGDTDARATASSHPDGAMWEFGSDSLKTWDQLMAVRKRALQTFSVDVLPDGRQIGEIEARLVPVYLLHRYQAEGLAHILGGGSYEYSEAGDVRAGTAKAGITPVPAATQRGAMTRLVDSLRAETLALPANVLDAMTPPAEGFDRNQEYFATRMQRVFDAMSAVEAGASQTSELLFEVERVNRLAWQHARDAQQPGVTEMFNLVLQRTWKRDAVPTAIIAGEAVQMAANWVELDAMLNLAGNTKLHPQVMAEVRQCLQEFSRWLVKNSGTGVNADSRKQAAELVQSYLQDPGKVKLRALPPVPPGAPI